MTRERLPIGIQTFQNIREDDRYYVIMSTKPRSP